MAGPLAKKELPDEGYSRRNGKREESSRQKKIYIIDNIVVNGLHADMKRKAEKTVEWRMLSLQCAEHYVGLTTEKHMGQMPAEGA